MIIEFNKEDISKIKRNDSFTVANNFDNGFENSQLVEFLADYSKYKRYAHQKLEEIIKDKEIDYKIRIHKDLDNRL